MFRIRNLLATFVFVSSISSLMTPDLAQAAGELDPTFGIYRYVQQGRMKAIAVTSAKRDPQAPEVQTVAETLPGFEVLSMNGIVVAGGTPRALVDRLNADFRKLLARPDVAKRMHEFGIQVVGNSPDEFAKFIRTEIERWTKVAKAAHISLDK